MTTKDKKSRYTFIKRMDEDNPYDSSELILNSEAETLPEILEDFNDFLRGCGFYHKGTLTIDDTEE